MSKASNAVPLLPLYGKVLILPQKKQTQTSSGLYLPDSGSSEKPQVGTVVRIGKTKKDEKGNDIEFAVKVGDTVMYKKYAGDEIEFEGEKYSVMDEEDIIAIFE